MIKFKLFMVDPHLKPHILFKSNGLAIWHGFPVITHIEVKSGSRLTIFNLIKLEFFMVYHYIKLHILFESNGLDICSYFSDITHIKK